MFTQEQLQTIKVLIGRTQLNGTEAVTVASLQLYIDSLLKPVEKVEEVKEKGKEK